MPLGRLPSSASLMVEKKELNTDRHFRWESIHKFIYLSATYSNHVYNFEIFSKICQADAVKFFDFVILQLLVGMAYMFMDAFIKQYTAKLDCNQHMNPLLRGVTYGLLLQTACSTVIQACYVADSFRFLAGIFHSEMPWCKCFNTKSFNESSCLSAKEIIHSCHIRKVRMNDTSGHLFYINSFSHMDRHIVTTRFFIMGLVWTCNFFISTISLNTLVKIFLLVFTSRLASTLVVLVAVLYAKEKHSYAAFLQIMDVNSPVTYAASMEHISFSYGIGYLGFFDFGIMSPYTMIDTAVILFSVMFTVFALMRSWIVRVLYAVMGECIDFEVYISPHYLLYGILPLSTHFMRANRLYSLYIYLNITVGTTTYLTMLTLSMSHLLHNEFRSVKNVYIVGLLCCMGFGFSVPIAVCMTQSTKVKGLVSGLNTTAICLGWFKAAIVLWVYGIKKFSTDIHFRLGFKPTQLWTLSWMMLPILLFVFMIQRFIITGDLVTDVPEAGIFALAWISLSLTLVVIVNAKIVSKYLVRNNLAGLFRPSLKYGPPDLYYRLKRKNYDETTQLRQCRHVCTKLDEFLDCNHMPLMQTSPSLSDESPMFNIFNDAPAPAASPPSNNN